MEWVELILKLLASLAVVIPLVVELVKYVNKASKEKNWGALLSLVMNLMTEAEEQFDNGADRKSWVLKMVEASAHTINYEINVDQVSELIDSMSTLSKKINVKGK